MLSAYARVPARAAVKHALLEWDAGRCWITDLSRNGTRVDGEPLTRGERVRLKDGAKLSLPSPTSECGVSFLLRVGVREAKDVYSFGTLLGAGAFGTVYEATHRVTGQVVAIKRLDKAKLRLSGGSAARRALRSEVAILRQCNHRHVVRLIEHFESDAYVELVMEKMSDGELFDRVKGGKLDEVDARGIFRQIAHGLAYLHKKGIAHRDLKLENILLNREDHPEPGPDGRKQQYLCVKLADFGVSRCLGEGSVARTFAGTPMYVAPEVMAASSSDKGYGTPADMWSAGIVLYMLLTGRQPFMEGQLGKTVQEQIEEGLVMFPEAHWRGVSAQAKKLVASLLLVDPAERLTAVATLQHPWLRKRRSSTRANGAGAGAVSRATRPGTRAPSQRRTQLLSTNGASGGAGGSGTAGAGAVSAAATGEPVLLRLGADLAGVAGTEAGKAASEGGSAASGSTGAGRAAPDTTSSASVDPTRRGQLRRRRRRRASEGDDDDANGAAAAAVESAGAGAGAGQADAGAAAGSIAGASAGGASGDNPTTPTRRSRDSGGAGSPARRRRRMSPGGNVVMPQSPRSPLPGAGVMPVCRYGASCFRTHNPVHMTQFFHPHLAERPPSTSASPRRAARRRRSSRGDDSTEGSGTRDE